MSDIDRNDPLWNDIYAATNSKTTADAIYLIATRHRDEAVARYKADAERLYAALDTLRRVRAMYGSDRTVSVDQIRTMENNATAALMDEYNAIDAARAAEREQK